MGKKSGRSIFVTEACFLLFSNGLLYTVYAV